MSDSESEYQSDSSQCTPDILDSEKHSSWLEESGTLWKVDFSGRKLSEKEVISSLCSIASLDLLCYMHYSVSDASGMDRSWFAIVCYSQPVARRFVLQSTSGYCRIVRPEAISMEMLNVFQSEYRDSFVYLYGDMSLKSTLGESLLKIVEPTTLIPRSGLLAGDALGASNIRKSSISI